MKIKKGDTVLVISGKDKGRTAKILASFPKDGHILVEGINMRQKHIKPKKQGEVGQVVKVPAPIDSSDVKLVCPKCGKAVRIGYKVTEDKKYRICKKCKAEV